MVEHEPISVIDQAIDVTNNYIVKSANEAFARVKREKSGEGCGCGNCANHWVDELNSWVEFIWKKPVEGTRYEHWVDGGTIYQYEE